MNTYANNTTRILVRESKRGNELYAHNFQHQKMLHVGTVRAGVYEKQSSILWSPEPSFCLGADELAAAEQAGAQLIRIVYKTAKHEITPDDFRLHAESYRSSQYGDQLRVALRFWTQPEQGRTRVTSPRSGRKAKSWRQEGLF